MSLPVDRMRTIRDAFLREVSERFLFSLETVSSWPDATTPTPTNLPLPTPQMRAGLDGKPSTLMILPSMVDVLPDG